MAPDASPTIEHHTVDVNGVTLHYAIAGRGELILFLHGFPEFRYAWKDQLEEFGRDHLAVAPDMRGYAPTDFVPWSASTKVTVPTLVIWGERDTALLTGNLEGLDAYVSNLSIRRIPEATHWVVHEKRGLVNRYIREFVTR